MSPPLTLDELIQALTRLRTENPGYGDKPVHILDMETDSPTNRDG